LWPAYRRPFRGRSVVPSCLYRLEHDLDEGTFVRLSIYCAYSVRDGTGPLVDFYQYKIDCDNRQGGSLLL
jgi:hypothetical protein